jgi:hypothetical protein
MEILDLFQLLIWISAGICVLFFLRLAYFAATLQEGLYKEYVCNLNGKIAVMSGIIFLLLLTTLIILTKYQ